jgi:hypothetical protein
VIMRSIRNKFSGMHFDRTKCATHQLRIASVRPRAAKNNHCQRPKRLSRSLRPTVGGWKRINSGDSIDLRSGAAH